MNWRQFLAAGCASLGLCSCGSDVTVAPASAARPDPTRTIIMVWDGLRPDSVNATDTPNLYALRQAGVNFTCDNHADLPDLHDDERRLVRDRLLPGRRSGFYGNTFWTPPQGAANTDPVGGSAGGSAQDYVTPVFTEDYQVLATLNNYYGGQLLLVKTLFASAQAAGLSTATIGKSGAAFIQDLGRGGYFLDENSVLPRSLVTELQANGFAIPVNTTKGYSGKRTPSRWRPATATRRPAPATSPSTPRPPRQLEARRRWR